MFLQNILLRLALLFCLTSGQQTVSLSNFNETSSVLLNPRVLRPSPSGLQPPRSSLLRSGVNSTAAASAGISSGERQASVGLSVLFGSNNKVSTGFSIVPAPSVHNVVIISDQAMIVSRSVFCFEVNVSKSAVRLISEVIF